MASLSLENEGALVNYFSPFVKNRSTCFQLSRTITHWVKFHGKEWTVKRLKDLKQQRILFETKSRRTLVKSHTDLSPVGSFRYLWDRKRVHFVDSLKALNVYTCEISDILTKSQVEKFVKAVQSDCTDQTFFNKIDLPRQPIKWNQFTDPFAWIRRGSTMAPYLDNGVVKTKPEFFMAAQELITSMTGEISNRGFLYRHRNVFALSLKVPETTFVKYVYPESVPTGIKPGVDYYAQINLPPIVGKIGLIQERGMKLRAVANPFRLLQHALYPLGSMLYDVLKGIDTDCTFDQEKGIAYARQSLKEGKTVYAFDLSNATDKFPLSVQLDLLSKLLAGLYPHDNPKWMKMQYRQFQQYELFKEVSRGRWYAPKLKNESGSDFIQWSQGQPLGLYPSFALFAVTHNYLVRDIEKLYNVTDSFRILGDDIIITHDGVAQTYKSIITSFGCEISDSKSIVSNEITEFAGKIITIDGDLGIEKWKPFSERNILGPLQSLGLDGLKFIPPRYRKIVRLQASLPKPFGLEINPDGIPLEYRVEVLEDKLWSKMHEDIVTDYTLSSHDVQTLQDDWWSKVKITPKGNYTYGNIDIFVPEIDDQSISVEERLGIEHYNAYILSLKNFEQSKLVRPIVKKTINRGDPRHKSPPVTSNALKYAKRLKEKFLTKLNPKPCSKA